MTDAEDRRALLRQEGVAAIIINAAMSVGFFLLVFGWAPATAHDLAIDFLPQSAGVAFLGTFIPSLLTYGRIARGKVIPAGPVPSKPKQFKRVLVAAAVAVVVFGGIAGLLMSLFAPPILTPLPALVVKTVYGAILGGLVTPPLIRSVLGMPMFAVERIPLAEAA